MARTSLGTSRTRPMLLAGLLLLALVIGASVARLGSPRIAQAAPTLSDDDKQAILRQHNDVRGTYNLQPLTWDDNLTALATEWANMLAAGTVTGHRPNNAFGENLYQASPPDSSPVTDAVTSWVGESSDYDAPSNTCAAGKVCGHFTQVVWAGTTKVGCAKASGNDWDYIVCNYDPPGNVNGLSPFAGAPAQQPATATTTPAANTSPTTPANPSPTATATQGPPSPGTSDSKPTFAFLGFAADTFAESDPLVADGGSISGPQCSPQVLSAGVRQANLPVGTNMVAAWSFNGAIIAQDAPFASAAANDDVFYNYTGATMLAAGLYGFILQAGGVTVAQGSVQVIC